MTLQIPGKHVCSSVPGASCTLTLTLCYMTKTAESGAMSNRDKKIPINVCFSLPIERLLVTVMSLEGNSSGPQCHSKMERTLD